MAWRSASRARAFVCSGQLALAAVYSCPEMPGSAVPSLRSSLVREGGTRELSFQSRLFSLMLTNRWFWNFLFCQAPVVEVSEIQS